jgi:hypothetical protein|tara:strand:- start:694 stop:1032 length:339 start_codon:yes stop_codon:yes gene_type:complete
MKHTKGQWEVSKTGASVNIKSGDVWIAGIHNQDTMTEGKSIVDKDCYDTSETEANANLIASAPDMLKALNDIMCYFSEYEEDYNEKLECFEYARKVISKADSSHSQLESEVA